MGSAEKREGKGGCPAQLTVEKKYNRQLRITKNQQSLAIKGFEWDFSTYVCLVFTYVFPL